MSKINEREEELWKSEAETAMRIIKWFTVLRKIRAADSVDAAELVRELQRADPEVLNHDAFWLTSFLHDRFQGEMRGLAGEKQLAEARAKRERKPPYTAAEYDAAEKTVGTKQQALAMKLGVSRTTLWKYGRPDD